MKHTFCFIIILTLGSMISCENIDFPETNETGHTISLSYEDTCYVYNEHVVAGEYHNDNGKTELLLLSLYEWKDMPSANHVEDSDLVRIITERYQEMELSDWQTPTLEEAKLLRENYVTGSEAFGKLNKVFLSIDALEINGESRYLCNDGQKSFSFASGTNISNAGTKTSNYRLRLVKRMEKH